MSLVDKAADKPVPLTGRADTTPDGGEFVDVQTTEPVTDWSDMFRRFNLDPDVFEVVGDTVRMSNWQQSKRTNDGDRDVVNLYSYRALFRRKAAAIDLPALYAEVRRTKVKPGKAAGGSTLVVAWADTQVGKVGLRGDTADLVRRLEQKRVALAAHIKARKLSRFVFVDVGDAIEGFENVASQMFTNDLSLPQQIDLSAVEMWKTLALLANNGRVDAVAIPSNHGAWRSGKQSLGRPSDDWGLAIQARLEYQAGLVGLPVTFHRPGDWDESVALDVRGTKLGVHHGHQSACDQMPKWWAGQQHGAQATADADILLTGHYHHLRVLPTGRSQRTGKSKWWLQAPTLDNGSDWYRNKSGDDSDPGLLVFEINDEGFDLSSLTIL
ncbi:hypothetical protein ASE16_03565 [Leifsonia sp. Root227]|uniref:hypothetical protein n=1 Tax=Leifsonia sp. Root227 TaxID=1736496 RepID=UPI0006FD52D5|nr:hypothetical protein [Leifsonia sp. Root227]KRC52139.1 hypothetical protein ASE16_03565 [Leifsonia sp. Root227]